MVPFISCLMVSKPGREGFAEQAIADFEAQTWPADRRELVIIRDEQAEGVLLGDLRNLSLDAAKGDIFIQWDDDDRHHPERIATQFEHLDTGGFDVSFLRSVTITCGKCGAQGITEWRLWEQTIMAKRKVFSEVRYRSLAIAEDTNLVARILPHFHVGALIRPDLYSYYCHGGNTWGLNHFDAIFRNSESSHRPSECYKE